MLVVAFGWNCMVEREQHAATRGRCSERGWWPLENSCSISNAAALLERVSLQRSAPDGMQIDLARTRHEVQSNPARTVCRQIQG